MNRTRGKDVSGVMEINGLPVHALVVHAAVVFGPLSALAGFAYAVPRWRTKVRWPLVVAVSVALVSIWVAYLSGERVEDANEYGGPLAALVEIHEQRAGVLRLSMTAFALVTYAAAWLHTRRSGWLPSAAAGVVAGFAGLTAVYSILTGDAGAQIAWYGTNG